MLLYRSFFDTVAFHVIKRPVLAKVGGDQKGCLCSTFFLNDFHHSSYCRFIEVRQWFVEQVELCCLRKGYRKSKFLPGSAGASPPTGFHMR